MQDREAFQDYIVLGVWDTNKRERRLDQFLLATDTVDDDSAEQLAAILTRKEIILKMAHGLAWNGVLTNIIECRKIGKGQFGRVCTQQVKDTVEETWKSVSGTQHSGSEDDNRVTLRTIVIRNQTL